jgi:hypothetical protein
VVTTGALVVEDILLAVVVQVRQILVGVVKEVRPQAAHSSVVTVVAV